MIEREQVENWLQEEGYDFESLEPPEQAFWILQVERPRRQTILHISCYRPTGDSVVVQRGVAVADAHQRKLSKLSQEKFQEFKFQLVKDLLQQPIQFQLEVENEQDVRLVVVAKRVWNDQLGKGELLTAVQTVANAGMLTVARIRRAAGDTI